MKRPWFRIHLSTAIVLMFFAGGLIWANLITQYAPSNVIPYFTQAFDAERGWPVAYYRENIHVFVNRTIDEMVEKSPEKYKNRNDFIAALQEPRMTYIPELGLRFDMDDKRSPAPVYFYGNLALDVGAAAGMEFFIRRREKSAA
jgi:hypothetical protein